MPEFDIYYSEEGEKIPLRRSDDAIAIAYKEEVPPKDLEKLIRGDDELAELITGVDLQRRRIVVYKRVPAARVPLEDFAARIARSDRVTYVSPVYYMDKSPVIISDEFIAAFKPGISCQAIDEWNAANDVEILPGLDLGPNTFLLRVKNPGTHGALDMVNCYFEAGLVEYAEPNFIYVALLASPFVPNDPLFPQQWHLTRVQAPEAWDITRGEPTITIAVLDDAIDTDHEDFASPGKLVHGQDFINGDSDPRPVTATENHGTAVAGVATANGDNGIGVTGIAPDCHLIPIRLVGAGDTALDAAAIRFAANNGGAILNNSWGRRSPLTIAVRRAFDHATDTGRGGKGCVILFAAHNYNEPVNLWGEASYDRTIAVAACNDHDVRSIYSNFGPEVNICAPSNDTVPGHTAIFTTDRMGNAGYNPPSSGVDPAGAAVNYTGTFGGTSSACPLAAGIAALVLSVNTDLNWQQVRYIIEATADKIDAANTDAVGQYQANGHSQWYGYGRVNTFEAVKGARSSVPDRDFVHRVTVTLRRTAGDRFVSDKVIQAIDARRRQAETAGTVFVRGGPDGFLRAELHPLFDEVEVDE
jgi:subtilisin family serine protease